MQNKTVDTDELLILTRCKSVPAAEECLNNLNIKFFRAGNKTNPAIFTTVGLIESAGGLGSESNDTVDKYL